jgi:hypothetical protein
MAVFSLTIPDAEVDRVTAAMCASWGYAEVSPANATLALISYIQATVVNIETEAATQSALDALPVVSPPAGLQ